MTYLDNLNVDSLSYQIQFISCEVFISDQDEAQRMRTFGAEAMLSSPVAWKTICGNFSNRDKKFGRTAGKQSVIIVVYSICFSKIKSVSRWSITNIDSILEQADELFNLRQTNQFRNAENLPDEICICGMKVSLTYSMRYLSTGEYGEQRFLQEKIVAHQDNNQGLLFISKIFCVGVIFIHKKGGISYAVFDPHGHKNSVATVLLFDKLQTLMEYFSLAYLIDLNKESCLFQLCVVDCCLDTDNESKRKNVIINFKRLSLSIKEQNRMHRKRRQSTASDEVPIKKLKPESELVKSGIISPDCLSSVKSFYNKIREGPFFVCTVCHRMLYRQTVRLLNPSSYPRDDLFTSIKCFDNKEYICRTCDSKIKKGNMPCQAVMNKMR